jgi:hypothetical protein
LAARDRLRILIVDLGRNRVQIANLELRGMAVSGERGTGIVDEHGYELEFPAAFRKRRGDFARKGIVRLKKP